MARWLGAALLLAALPAFAQSDDLAVGRFLVASRDLGDPNFAQTVVLLVHYSEDQGAVGLVINRRSDVALSRVFQDMKEAKGRSDPVYVGGPVDLTSALALLRSPSKPDDAARVFGDVYLIASKARLQAAMASGAEASVFHAYLGYAGWGPGQLEHEVELKAWNIIPADAANVFHADPDSVWPRLIRRSETQIARAARPTVTCTPECR